MTRHVKAKREEIRHKKSRGLISQFIIFLILRSIDLAASIAVLHNAWSHSADWESLNDTLFNTTNNIPGNLNSLIIKSRSVKPRSINLRRIVPRRIRHRSFVPESFNPLNSDSRNFEHRNSDPWRNYPQSITPRRIVPSSNHLHEKKYLYKIDLHSNHIQNLLPRNLDARNLDSWKFGPRNSDPRRNDPPRDDPRLVDLRNFPPQKIGLRNVDDRNYEPTTFDPLNVGPRNTIPRIFNPGKTDPRRDEHLNIKRRSVNSQGNSYTSNDAQYMAVNSGSSTTDHCRHIGQWNKKEVYSKISEYETIIGFTIFFNIVSLSVFLTHLGFWIATLKITFQDGTEYKTWVTRLTRNSLLSLMTAIFRDVPLSCLNVELLALRSSRDGLACVACIFAGKCRQDDYIVNSLNLAKSLLYFNYFIMLINSFWKGVSGFYRLSRFKEFNIYIIRACASIVFGFLYCIATFTPAMFMFIYRYFAMPGLDAPFLQDLAKKLVVIGATIWVTFVSAVVCCPILYLIRLSAD